MKSAARLYALATPPWTEDRNRRADLIDMTIHAPGSVPTLPQRKEVDAFKDAKTAEDTNVLLGAVQRLLSSDAELKKSLLRVTGREQLPPPVNQWAFLTLAYAAFVYLAEARGGWGKSGKMRKLSGVDVLAGNFLASHLVDVTPSPGAKKSLDGDCCDVFRRIRNSISHGNFIIKTLRFEFWDEDKRKDGEDRDQIIIELPWETLAAFSWELIVLCSADLQRLGKV